MRACGGLRRGSSEAGKNGMKLSKRANTGENPAKIRRKRAKPGQVADGPRRCAQRSLWRHISAGRRKAAKKL
jgi:hypothetical protein